MITESQLKQVMPHLPAQKLQLYLPHLNAAMRAHGVDSALRTAAFVAQLAHESGEFRFMEEIWGPIAAQLRYEPPSDLAQRLGNTDPGDGQRFKGRGPIQITGRFNYRKYGDLLGIDLVAEPERAAQPEVAFATAGLFWQRNGLNELADTEQFVAITKRINGGTNGLDDRQQFYERAKSVLATGFVADEAPATRGATRGARRLDAPLEPLSRGHEAMVELGVQPAPAAKKAPARKKAAPRKRLRAGEART
ncbi:MAG TPA: glycoside hydrolase family 19 protein [Albitalea sp.]|uniref:glycoside hydrolase family 19 protein n=1 Tax=Piscinibacter sp. TaxID=1903157 RepID=UPI002ECFEF3A